MRKKEVVIDVCHLCGKYTELTKEHIPPKAAFNRNKLYHISGFDVEKILHKENFKPQIKQDGSYTYSLCKDCNNNTGSWYAKDYSNFCNDIIIILRKYKITDNKWLTIKAKKIKFGNIIKQIICMFVSSMDNEIVKEYGFDKYLLNKDNFELDTTKFKLYCYVNAKTIEFNSTGILTMFSLNNNAIVPYSFLGLKTYPLGFILSLNPDYVTPEWKKMFDMEELIKIGNTEIDMQLSLPIMNDYCHPFDKMVNEALNKKLEKFKK